MGALIKVLLAVVPAHAIVLQRARPSRVELRHPDSPRQAVSALDAEGWAAVVADLAWLDGEAGAALAQRLEAAQVWTILISANQAEAIASSVRF